MIDDVIQLDKETWLASAARNSNDDEVAFLLEYGAEGSQISSSMVSSSKALLEHDICPISDTCLASALTKAIIQGKQLAVSKLLAYNAQKEKSAVADQLSKWNSSAARTLLEHGYDFNAISSECKRTPLHWAAHWGFKDVVEDLLARGASVNTRDGSRWTALMLALSSLQLRTKSDRVSYMEIVEILMKQEPDLSIVTTINDTALSILLRDSVIDDYPSKVWCREMLENVLKRMHAQRYIIEDVANILPQTWYAGVYGGLPTWAWRSDKLLTRQLASKVRERFDELQEDQFKSMGL